MPVTFEDLVPGVSQAGVAGRPVCLHSSLSSFGHVDGGAATVVDGFLHEGGTLLVPTFSWEAYEVIPPPPDLRPARNGTDYDLLLPRDAGRTFTTADNELGRSMGAIPAEVLRRDGRRRGDHPLCSFTAVGPDATALTAAQTPIDVFAPLEALARPGGSVVLAGVGLERMTLLHRAEEVAGRTLFRRWARNADGDVAWSPSAGVLRGSDGSRTGFGRSRQGSSSARARGGSFRPRPPWRSRRPPSSGTPASPPAAIERATAASTPSWAVRCRSGRRTGGGRGQTGRGKPSRTSTPGE